MVQCFRVFLPRSLKSHLIVLTPFDSFSFLSRNLSVRPASGASTGSKNDGVDTLSKQELEHRLERAKKFGLKTELVDAMKARLRKYRFEESK